MTLQFKSRTTRTEQWIVFTEIAIPVNFTKKHSRKIKDTVLQTDQVSAGMGMKEGSAARGH